ncbi:MAG TPA: sulfite reductase, partial [Ilumatobacteraceae bacterium]|nr:sulfite reductase [Ilumatobacteraceae bacterium]
VEPIYGDTYLPRKFKIGVAWPGDNSIDIFSQDVGLLPTLADGTSGELTGFVVYVGGGMGMNWSREDDTYPRLASVLGWVPAEHVVDVVEAVVTTQRDHGDRVDRQQARLKYLVDKRGTEWMIEQVQTRSGVTLQPVPDLPPFAAADYHGWLAEGDQGTWTLGLPVQSGRVADADSVALRSALRELAGSGMVAGFHVSPVKT